MGTRAVSSRQPAATAVRSDPPHAACRRTRPYTAALDSIMRSLIVNPRTKPVMGDPDS
jgi:hypothetical protein